MTEISIFVQGIPQPQGALKSIPYQSDNGKMGVRTFNKSKKLEPWRERVERAIRDKMEESNEYFNVDDPVKIHCIFYLPVPKAQNKKIKGHPLYVTVRPDLDKYIRAIFDAFTLATGTDDSRIWSSSESKKYTNNYQEVGVNIVIIQEPQVYAGGTG